MNRYLIPMPVMFVLVALGCASRTSEIRTPSMYGQAEINQPYAQAASCLSRLLDERLVYGLIRKRLGHTLRTSQDGGVELVGDRDGTIFAGGTYLVSVHPGGPNSSTVRIYVSKNMLSQGDITEDIKKAAADCDRPIGRTPSYGQ